MSPEQALSSLSIFERKLKKIADEREQMTRAKEALELDLHQTTFAMGEAIAHLNALWLKGELRRELGADGVYRFSPA